MELNKDFYKILGVEKNATQEDIKKAFRSLSKLYHPDVAGGDEEKFKEINEANSILSDNKQRQQYDLTDQMVLIINQIWVVLIMLNLIWVVCSTKTLSIL